VNALNRNEEEKIIQATSILLSGNFIPLTTASTEGGTGMALRETLTGGAVVVNPLDYQPGNQPVIVRSNQFFTQK
jgi:translocation and assembly module TamB